MSIVKDLYDKRVVLVGPSPSLKGSGQLIDNYDKVIRMNSALPISEDNYEDVGHHTDALVTGLAEDYLNKHSKQKGYTDRLKEVYDTIWIPAKELGLKYLITWHPASTGAVQKRVKALEEINTEFEVVYIPLNIHKQITHSIGGSTANTGVLAIDYLMTFKITELFVTGITFFRDGYREGYHPSMPTKITNKEGYKQKVIKSGHNVDAQLKYIEKYKNPVFQPDDVLRKILGWD